jgi:WD40-like Beta Propeller Repeat
MHMNRRNTRTRALLGALVGAACVAAAAAYGGHFSGWAPAQKIDEVNGNHPDLNTSSLDGCPILSPDGRSLYIASDRPGGHGGLDIWVAHRSSKKAPFGAPVNLPAPINSASADFCPTPVRGGLFFVSRRATSESCGLGDMYFASHHRKHGWGEPVHLGCDPVGPNTNLDEQGPSLVRLRGTTYLYFSRSVPVPPGTSAVPGDLYVSQLEPGGFGSATPIAELNDPAANDIQPNLRRDGLEIVFSSNRTGVLGTQDIWVSTRSSIREPWSTPVNLGPNVNTGAGESRPSFSRDARTLLLGRAPGPEGSSDIFITTREHIGGGDDDDGDAADDDDDD